MSNDFIEFGSPVGRYVQGSFKKQVEKDDNNKPKLDDNGVPIESVYFTVAFEKGNPEWLAFKQQIHNAAATFWPQFFPQGGAGPCTHPQFSMKIIDGDDVDAHGKPNNQKPGFAGHELVRFKTQFEPKCFYEGKFAPHEVMQGVESVIKTGFYIRVIGKFKSNKATGTQKPGVAVYPDFVSFVRQGVEIVTGVPADQQFAKYALGSVPAAAGAAPLAHPGSVAVAAPSVTPPAVAAPVVVAPPVQAPVVVAPPATPQLSPAFLAQYPGMTFELVRTQGHTEEQMRSYGWLV